jgi:hypothetical protein
MCNMTHFTSNIWLSGDQMVMLCKYRTSCIISASRSYGTVRSEVKMERVGGGKKHYVLSFPLPPHTSAGWPRTCVFVTVNAAWRHLVTCVMKPEGSAHHTVPRHTFIEQSMIYWYELGEEVYNPVRLDGRYTVLQWASKAQQTLSAFDRQPLHLHHSVLCHMTQFRVMRIPTASRTSTNHFLMLLSCFLLLQSQFYYCAMSL